MGKFSGVTEQKNDRIAKKVLIVILIFVFLFICFLVSSVHDWGNRGPGTYCYYAYNCKCEDQKTACNCKYKNEEGIEVDIICPNDNK